MRPTDKSKFNSVSIIRIRLGCILLLVLLIGLVESIVVPPLVKSNANPWVWEAQGNLLSLYRAQRQYFRGNQKYANHTLGKNCFELLKWRPDYVSPGIMGNVLMYWYPHYFNLERIESIYNFLKIKPSDMSRYSYYCESAIKPATIPLRGCNPVPPNHAVSANSFTLYAIGNIDNDDHCDVWSINDAKMLRHLEDDRQL